MVTHEGYVVGCWAIVLQKAGDDKRKPLLSGSTSGGALTYGEPLKYEDLSGWKVRRFG
jgi:hypothetical protein